jgi:hypothetical protein
MTGFLKGALLCSLATLAAAQPAHAAMSCWDQKATSAAKLRDLQSRLMVATLRCRAMGIDVYGSYNGFVKANRTTIQSANDTLKQKFNTAYGKAGQTHYDRFTTALANAYGGDATNNRICDETRDVAKEAARANGNFERLVAIQDRFGEEQRLPGGTCRDSFAARR